MSFWYGDASSERPVSIGTGRAPLDELWQATKEQLRFVDNSNSRYTALHRAYGDRIKTIRDRTGETRANPLDGEVGFLPWQKDPLEEVRSFNEWLTQLQTRHPDAADAIRADMPVERDAEAIAKNADERMARAVASQDGGGKWVGILGGGLQGSLHDPLQVLSLFAGGGPGGAKTAIGRIATVMLKETAVNGLSEAAIQPSVQSWRKQVGLPNGIGEALKNIGFAAALGGILGGGLAGAGEAIGRAFRGRELDQVAGELAKSPAVRPDVADGLRGNPERALEAITPLRNDLPAEARGAIDHAELLARDAAVRPAAATVPHHDQAIDRATRAALSDQPMISEASPEQIARIVEQLAPSIGDAAPAEQTLQQFLMRSGGLKDFKGELDALGLSNVSERFVGKLVRENGMPLDDARRVAAEAGFFNNTYGTADEAMAKSTVNDLLEALDNGSRSEMRVRGGDVDRAYVENLVADLTARAGPAVDDGLIIRAAKLVNSEDLDPADALDRVLIEHDRQQFGDDAGDFTPAPGRTADITQTTGGLSDPGHPDDDALFTAADLDGVPDDYDIPFFDDGRTLTGPELMGEFEHMDNLFQLVEACRA